MKTKTKMTKDDLAKILQKRNIPKEISLSLYNNFSNFSSKDLENILLILNSNNTKFLQEKRQEYFSKVEDSFSKIKKTYQEFKNKNKTI